MPIFIWIALYFPIQDLIEKPSYKLVVTKGTAHADYLSSANIETNPVQATLWRRMKDDPNSQITSMTDIETLLLENQNYVFFGSYSDTVLGMPSVPCLITPTSKSIFRVTIYVEFYLVKFRN